MTRREVVKAPVYRQGCPSLPAKSRSDVLVKVKFWRPEVLEEQFGFESNLASDERYELFWKWCVVQMLLKMLLLQVQVF